MKVEQERMGTVEVLTPNGALVDQEAAEFSKLLLERVRAPNARVIVSMQEVPYMDSIAVEGLLDATDELADRAANLRLVKVPATCREILDLTGIRGKFTFFEDARDAVRSFL